MCYFPSICRPQAPRIEPASLLGSMQTWIGVAKWHLRPPMLKACERRRRVLAAAPRGHWTAGMLALTPRSKLTAKADVVTLSAAFCGGHEIWVADERRLQLAHAGERVMCACWAGCSGAPVLAVGPLAGIGLRLYTCTIGFENQAKHSAVATAPVVLATLHTLDVPSCA